jgi:hypothetical protein
MLSEVIVAHPLRIITLGITSKIQGRAYLEGMREKGLFRARKTQST